jgi:hypothetical protein
MIFYNYGLKSAIKRNRDRMQKILNKKKLFFNFQVPS